MHFQVKMNNGHIDSIKNNKYRKKYKHMKRKIKSLIIENAALCDEVARVQENILIAKEERKILLRKVLEHENAAEVYIYNKNPTHNVSMNGSKVKKKKSQEDIGRNQSGS